MLNHLDRVQKRFLREVGLTPEEAFLRYRLLPLQTRRDIACLGVVHRAVLNKGPPHFKKWFFFRQGPPHSYETLLQAKLHTKQLHDYLDGSHNELLRRSVLGLPQVYNKLPPDVVDAPSVKSFQRRLQQLVERKLREGNQHWQGALNLRQVSFAAEQAGQKTEQPKEPRRQNSRKK